MGKCCCIIFLHVGIVLALQAHGVFSEYYSSISDLKYLLDAEAYMIENLEYYMANVEKENNDIENFLDDVDSVLDVVLGQESEIYYSDPINAFTTINRMVTYWRNNVFDKILSTANIDAYKNNLTILHPTNFTGPTEKDLQGAVKALVRLQETYKLPVPEVADGRLLDVDVFTTLSPSDCFVIGHTLYELGENQYAIEWLIEAQSRLLNDNTAGISLMDVDKLDLLVLLSAALFQRGNTKLALKLNNEILKIDQENEYGVKNQELYSAKLLKELNTQLPINNEIQQKSKSKTIQLYERVCREEVQQTPREQRNLRCRYTNNNIPYRVLAPFKVEELNHDPFVAYYHDVLADNEIKTIIDLSELKLERSQVGNLNDTSTSDVRTSKTSWLYYKDYDILSPIKRRLEDITGGLSTESAEPWQVVNYGIGGQYEPHYDFVVDAEQTFGANGNRLLTAMFYLSDVEMGGSTAFPFLHLAVPPVKGSLLLWYNLHASMEKDFRTKHAGCPVLLGSKWVCNQWFHETGQELRRPCGLQPDGALSIAYADEELHS